MTSTAGYYFIMLRVRFSTKKIFFLHCCNVTTEHIRPRWDGFPFFIMVCCVAYTIGFFFCYFIFILKKHTLFLLLHGNTVEQRRLALCFSCKFIYNIQYTDPDTLNRESDDDRRSTIITICALDKTKTVHLHSA